MLAFSRPRLPRTMLAIAFTLTIAGCQAATAPTSVPATSTPPPSTSAPSVTATAAPARLGTITLTDTGCTWVGNPGSVAAGPVTIQVWNETDHYTDFFVHKLRAGQTWADGEAAIAAIREALGTGADWPPAVSDEVAGTVALAGLGNGLAFDATAGTHGVVCSASTSSTGDILTVFLVGPLVVSA